MLYSYKYPRPALTVDILLLRFGSSGEEELLLVQRARPPFKGGWALPGGFVDHGEKLENAAQRELLEETGLNIETLQQLRAYGDPDRDPREHTVSIVYGARLKPDEENDPRAGSDASNVRWFPILNLPELVFDHQRIVQECRPLLDRPG